MTRRALATLLASATLFASPACTPSSGSNTQTPKAAVTPVLDAVLLPGPRPTFARPARSSNSFEGLPSPSIILRMTNALPEGPQSINVSLAFLSGGTTGRLQLIPLNDAPAAQALSTVGAYSVAIDSYGYSVIIMPPVAQRSGAGFLVTMKNTAANPPGGSSSESAPLTVSIVPKSGIKKPSEVFFDCGQDVVGSLFHNCKPSVSTVLADMTLEGWLVTVNNVNAPGCMGPTLCVEDVHWDFIPNVDFINSYYSSFGAFHAILGQQPFANVMMPGNPPQAAAAQLPFEDVSITDGSRKGVTINSFLFDWNGTTGTNGSKVALIWTELNAWHVRDQGNVGDRQFVGRGVAPPGWMQIVVDVNDPNRGAWENTRWPWDPRNPDLGLAPIVVGDYVRMNGTLWTDEEHQTPHLAWEAAVPGHGGWNELHPVNWMERRPSPSLRKTAAFVSTINVSGAPTPFVTSITPEAVKQSGEVLRCRELIDGRFTRPSAIVGRRTISIANDVVTVTVTTVAGDRFKATYVLWWEQGAASDTGCAPG